MDTTEIYMKDFIRKVIQKARIRTQDQEVQKNLNKDQVGNITTFKSV